MLRPVIRPVLRDAALSERQGGGTPPAPSLGALEIDTFPILIDTFEIIFS